MLNNFDSKQALKGVDNNYIYIQILGTAITKIQDTASVDNWGLIGITVSLIMTLLFAVLALPAVLYVAINYVTLGLPSLINSFVFP